MVRNKLLAALLAAAAASSPLTARADPTNVPEDDRQRRCDAGARMRAFPRWCREAAPDRDEEERRERVRREERR